MLKLLLTSEHVFHANTYRPTLVRGLCDMRAKNFVYFIFLGLSLSMSLPALWAACLQRQALINWSALASTVAMVVYLTVLPLMMILVPATYERYRVLLETFYLTGLCTVFVVIIHLNKSGVDDLFFQAILHLVLVPFLGKLTAKMLRTSYGIGPLSSLTMVFFLLELSAAQPDDNYLQTCKLATLFTCMFVSLALPDLPVGATVLGAAILTPTYLAMDWHNLYCQGLLPKSWWQLLSRQVSFAICWLCGVTLVHALAVKDFGTARGHPSGSCTPHSSSQESEAGVSSPKRGLLHRLEYYLLRIKQSLTAQDSTLVLALLFTATPLSCFLKFFRLYLDATCHQKAGPCEQFVSFICMYLLGTLQLEHMQLSITSRLQDAQELLCDLLPTHVVQLLLAAGAAKRQREQGLISAVAILGIGNHTPPQTSLDNLSQRTPPHKSSSRHRLRTQATNVSNGSAGPSAHTEDVARRRHRSAHRSPSSLCQSPHVAPTTSHETLAGGYLIPSVLSEQDAAAAAVSAPSLQPAMHEGLEPDQDNPLTFPTPQQSTERQPLQHLSSLLLPTGPHSSSLEFAIDIASGSSGPGSHPQHTSSLPSSLPPQSSSRSHPAAGLLEVLHKHARQGDAACSSLPQPYCPKSAEAAPCQLHDPEAQYSPDASGHPKAPVEPGLTGHCSIAACVVPATSPAPREGSHPAPGQPGSCEWGDFCQQTQQLVTKGPPEQQQQDHGLDGNSQSKVGSVCSKKAKEGWSRRVLGKLALALSRNRSWTDKKVKRFKRAEAAALSSIAPTTSDQAAVPVMNSLTQPPDGGQQRHLHRLEGNRDNSSQTAAPAAPGPSLAAGTAAEAAAETAYSAVRTACLPHPSPILTPTTATPFEDILASIVRQGTGELQVTSGFLTSLDGSVFASLSTVGQAQLAEIVYDDSGDLHSAMSDAVPDPSQSSLPTVSRSQSSTGIELWQLPAPLHTSSRRSQPHTFQAPAPHTPALQPSSLNPSHSMPVSNTSSTRMLELFGLRSQVPASQEGLSQDAASSPSWSQLLYNSLMTPSGVLKCGFSAALFSNGRTQPSEAIACPPAVASERQLGNVDGSNHAGRAGTAGGANPWLSWPGMNSLLYSNAEGPPLRHTHDGATHLREGTSDGAERPGSPLSSQEEQDQLLSTDSIDMGVGAGSEGGLQGLTSQLAEWHDNISIIFSDVVGFTDMAQQVHPQLVMTMLNDMYSRFDDLCLAFGNAVYKVETIGDSLMVATGLMRKDPDHAATAVRFAMLMRSAAHKVSLPTTAQPVQIRIGIHSGRAMSGIVGKLRRRFCLFGDTVNTASRMESSSSQPGAVHISNDTYLLVRHLEEYQFACRGSVDIKGKGLMTTWWVEPRGTRGAARLRLLPSVPPSSALAASSAKSLRGESLGVEAGGIDTMLAAAMTFAMCSVTQPCMGNPKLLKKATARLNTHRVIAKDKRKGSDKHKKDPGKKQPCEEELNKLSATRPAGWKPPAGQVEQRLVRPAWSQQRDQPVRGLMWCPVVAPRKPPQAPGSSQAATPAAASEPGPSNPPPAKRSKRTEAEQAAEPTQPTKGKGKAQGKATEAKPAPQPGRWLDRDCNASLNIQRIGRDDQGALPAKGKEYPGLGYKQLRDKPPKAQQQQQPAMAQ
ncbi:hypothetical protein QJQ45_017824, partial [Haematococcus lacustris]